MNPKALELYIQSTDKYSIYSTQYTLYVFTSRVSGHFILYLLAVSQASLFLQICGLAVFQA